MVIFILIGAFLIIVGLYRVQWGKRTDGLSERLSGSEKGFDDDKILEILINGHPGINPITNKIKEMKIGWRKEKGREWKKREHKKWTKVWSKILSWWLKSCRGYVVGKWLNLFFIMRIKVVQPLPLEFSISTSNHSLLWYLMIVKMQ